MGIIFTNCKPEQSIIDEMGDTSQKIWNNMEHDNVFRVILGKTLARAQKEFPNYIFRIVSLDGYSCPVEEDYEVRRINVNMITVDGTQLIDSIQSVG